MTSKYKEVLSCHGAFEFLYKRLPTPTLIKTPNHILAATLFIANSVNSVLSFVTQGDTSKNAIEFKRNRDEAANSIGTMYPTLQAKDVAISIQSVIQTFGEITLFIWISCLRQDRI